MCVIDKMISCIYNERESQNAFAFARAFYFFCKKILFLLNRCSAHRYYTDESFQIGSPKAITLEPS